MCTRVPLSSCPTACAAAIPAPTSWAISPGVSMVASRFWVGSLAPGGGLPVGRFRSYRSLSSSLGGGEGEGGAPLCGGLGGGPPLPAPPVPWGLYGGLIAGTARGLCRCCWVPPSKGLPSISRVGGASGLGVGRVRLAGVAGRGTAVATRNNSFCAWASRCSRLAIRSWSSFRCRSSISTSFGGQQPIFPRCLGIPLGGRFGPGLLPTGKLLRCAFGLLVLPRVPDVNHSSWSVR